MSCWPPSAAGLCAGRRPLVSSPLVLPLSASFLVQASVVQLTSSPNVRAATCGGNMGLPPQWVSHEADMDDVDSSHVVRHMDGG